jgi:hypothetical protein
VLGREIFQLAPWESTNSRVSVLIETSDIFNLLWLKRLGLMGWGWPLNMSSTMIGTGFGHRYSFTGFGFQSLAGRIWLIFCSCSAKFGLLRGPDHEEML